jgi:hypothetical protein
MQLYTVHGQHPGDERHLHSRKRIYFNILLAPNSMPIPERIVSQYNLVIPKFQDPEGFEEPAEFEDEEMQARLVQAQYAALYRGALDRRLGGVTPMLPTSPIDFWTGFIALPLAQLTTISMHTESERLETVECVLDCIREQAVVMSGLTFALDGSHPSCVTDPERYRKQLVVARAALQSAVESDSDSDQDDAVSAQSIVTIRLQFIHEILQRMWPDTTRVAQNTPQWRTRVQSKQRILTMVTRAVPDILLSRSTEDPTPAKDEGSVLGRCSLQ